MTDTNQKSKRQKQRHTGGIFSNAEEIKVGRTGGTWAAKYGSKVAQWDIAPDDEYFKELFRVSKRQIIWGGNYFNLGASRCYLVWRKSNIPAEGFSLAPVELAWTSLNENAAYFECGSNGAEDGTRIHPTQKPIVIYMDFAQVRKTWRQDFRYTLRQRFKQDCGARNGLRFCRMRKGR